MLYLMILIDILLSAYIVILLNKRTSEETKKGKSKRTHAKLAKTSFSTPLDPYEVYKDKKSGLYEPRHAKGGVRIEVDKE